MGLAHFFFSLNAAASSQNNGILSPALDFRGSDNSQYIALI